MKMKYPGTILTIILFIASVRVPLVFGQEYHKTFHKKISFMNPGSRDNTVRIYNINGNVHVIGYKGNKVELTYEKKITGRSEDALKRAANEIKLKTEQSGNNITVYLEAPFIKVWRNGSDIRYNYYGDERDFHFVYNITIKIPQKSMVYASTINGGEVKVENTNNVIHASNVNGAILLQNISGKTKASAVNGNITAVYSSNPDAECTYRTVNGKLDVTFQRNLSADIKYDIMNGHLYTNFDKVETIPSVAKISKRSSGKGIEYRIGKNSMLRIGKGGKLYQFHVLNGSIFIRHN